ncbi:MAG: glutathione S-transferase family protein [Casimicrobiaceae bacterium]
MKLYLGNRNYSSWSLRGWLAAKLSGLAFEAVQVPLAGIGPNPANRSFSPSGLVPCLHDGDVVAWDSLAIAETLAERVPAMWPSDRTSRAHARAISAEMHSGFAALRSGMTMCIRERVDVRPWSAALAGDLARIEEIFAYTRHHFGGDGHFLCGQFSIADCFYAPVAFRFQTYGVSLPDAAGEYVAALLAHSWLREWEKDALAETAIIDADEPRVVYRDHLAASR